MKVKRGVVLVLCAACIVMLLGGAVAQPRLKIPTLTEIQQNGYPVNALGETYGINDRESTAGGPDLILAINESGVVGYVRDSEMESSPVLTLEDARNYQPRSFYVNMYREDGRTVIGRFHIGEELS